MHLFAIDKPHKQIDNNVFHDVIKEIMIIQIFKKGDVSDHNN